MDKINEILIWRLHVKAKDLKSQVAIGEVMEKLSLSRRVAADAMDRFCEENGVQKTAPVSERGGNSNSRIFSMLGVEWKTEEELLSDSKLVVFTGEQ